MKDKIINYKTLSIPQVSIKNETTKLQLSHINCNKSDDDSNTGNTLMIKIGTLYAS